MHRDDPALATELTELRWQPVCALDAIWPNTGVCALLEGHAIAIFRFTDAQGQDRLFALDNLDPKSGASVLSRGLVGNLGDRLVVASPLYKQHFCLETGLCLEAPEQALRAYPVRIDGGQVLVAH